MAVEIVNRNYSNFRGVDFSNSEVNLYRSPDSVNMWKNYDDGEGIETRPGMTLLGEFGSQIFGLFFYKVQNVIQVIVHAGTKLYRWTNYPNSPVEKTELFSGMKPAFSNFHVFNNILYIHDGLNYLEYNGTTCKSVEGTIPITRLGTTPSGAIYKDDADYVYQDINCLTSLRKNGFVADGESTDYYLDSTNLDPATTYIMHATVNGVDKIEAVDFTVDRTNGVVTFNQAPTAPLEDGDSNVIITYSKTNTELANRVKKCTISVEFDNRIFFSGNPDYPNTVFHTELEDPRYVSTQGYSTVGLDTANIKALIPGNDILWVFKETVQNYSNVFYLTPTIDNELGKIYPSVTGNISTGCISTGVNFNDDICFFSRNGLEAIGKTLGDDQILVHRSSMVDSKMISNTNYKNVKIAEYRGYLMCLLDSKVFLADSRNLFEKTAGKNEYEWFYWELPNTINFMTEYQNDLYLGNADGKIYILEGTTDTVPVYNEQTEQYVETSVGISSKWTTTRDTFKYASYRKITNKRGGTASVKSMNNDAVKLKTITDLRTNEIGTYNDSKGYIVYRVKEKKWKWIQLEFSSNKPFGLFSCTLESFIGGYVKR